ncbi:MAG: alkaline phosphatase [Bacteroidales bacterium]|nr:alkaline phosphatase [Bacteroidales bacterium]
MKKIKLIRSIFVLIAALLTSTLNAQEAKYIFYFIGDGMGNAHVMMTDNYRRLALGQEQPLNMLQLPVHSFATTYSASSPVTDSAAAGTALSTGSKTRNSMLGMNADTIAVTSIAKYLHDSGYGVAIMTNVAADDATPGAFYAHVPNRSMSYEIGRQAAESGYELIAGASLRGLTKDGKSTGLAEYIASQGVDLLTSPEAVAASTNRRIILTPSTSIWEWDMGFTVDSIPGAMSVNDLTVTAINHLTRHTPDKFFMMIESGNIDHAAHANDGGAVVKEVYAFDNAIGTALDFYRQHPDETLIIITADHETGGMTVGNNCTGYMAHPEYLVPQSISKDMFSIYCDSIAQSATKPSWEQMKAYLTDHLGLFTTIPLSQSREDHLRGAFNATFIKGESERQETLYSNFNAFPVEVFNILNEEAGIGWTTRGHSGNFVPVFAIGVGSDLFTGLNDNTAIPMKILKAANIRQ